MTDRELFEWLLWVTESAEHFQGKQEMAEALRDRLAQPEPEPVALRVVRGEICYKSDNDDNSYGMWCPVNYDTQHGFPNGTNFYTAPPSIEAAVKAEREACAKVLEAISTAPDMQIYAAAIRARDEK